MKLVVPLASLYILMIFFFVVQRAAFRVRTLFGYAGYRIIFGGDFHFRRLAGVGHVAQRHVAGSAIRGGRGVGGNAECQARGLIVGAVFANLQPGAVGGHHHLAATGCFHIEHRFGCLGTELV